MRNSEPGPESTYRWLTDESEAASGDNIVYADETEYTEVDDED